MAADTPGQLVARLTAATESLTAAMESMRREHREAEGKQQQSQLSFERAQAETREALGRLEEQFKSVATWMTELNRLVRDGNGQPSITQRLAIQETRMQAVQQAVKDVDDRVERTEQMLRNELRATVGDARKDFEAVKGHVDATSSARVLSRGQIIGGVLALLVTIIMAVLGAWATVWSALHGK